MSDQLRIRQSAMKKFKRCRRSWYLQYSQGWMRKQLEGESDSGRALGTLVHEGLEAYHRSDLWEPDPADENTELARIMVAGYRDWLEEGGFDVGLETVAVEWEFELPIGWFQNRETLVYGTVDRVVYDTVSKKYAVIDNKTVANLGQQPEWGDDQLLTYACAVEQVFGPVGWVAHDLLRKVKRTSRSKPPYYDRWVMHMNDTMLAKHHEHMRSVASDIARASTALSVESAMLWPNPTRDCSWDCDFRSMCAMVDDGSDYATVLSLAYEKSEDN